MTVESEHWSSFQEHISGQGKSLRKLIEKDNPFTNLALHKVTIRDSIGDTYLTGLAMKFIISTLDSGVFACAVSADNIHLKGWAQSRNIKLTLRYHSEYLQIKKLETNWSGGRLIIRAKLPLPHIGGLKGSCAFQKVTIDRLSQKILPEKTIFTGLASGSFLFKGLPWDKKRFNVDGKLTMKNTRLKNFSFQQDVMIKNFMPKLSDITLHNLEIKKFRIRRHKLYVDSVNARGNPLSFKGRGTITKKGTLSFGLKCHLNKGYYQSLDASIQDGLYLDDKKQPTFTCRLEGNLDKQHIVLKKVFVRVLKTKMKRLGKTIKNLFQ